VVFAITFHQQHTGATDRYHLDDPIDEVIQNRLDRKIGGQGARKIDQDPSPGYSGGG
jgi:hypothetical protein